VVYYDTKTLAESRQAAGAPDSVQRKSGDADAAREIAVTYDDALAAHVAPA